MLLCMLCDRQQCGSVGAWMTEAALNFHWQTTLIALPPFHVDLPSASTPNVQFQSVCWWLFEMSLIVVLLRLRGSGLLASQDRNEDDEWIIITLLLMMRYCRSVITFVSAFDCHQIFGCFLLQKLFNAWVIAHGLPHESTKKLCYCVLRYFFLVFHLVEIIRLKWIDLNKFHFSAVCVDLCLYCDLAMFMFLCIYRPFFQVDLGQPVPECLHSGCYWS